MKIKIGNFNFIFNMENKLRDFIELQYKDYYFWLDGKEDSLYVTNISNFEKNIYRQEFDISEENDQKMLTKLGSTNKLEGTIKLAGGGYDWGIKIVVRGEEITKIVIPDTVVKIAESVFFRFVNIESVQLDANLREIGDIQGISVLDHLVVSDSGYFSFFENNLME